MPRTRCISQLANEYLQLGYIVLLASSLNKLSVETIIFVQINSGEHRWLTPKSLESCTFFSIIIFCIMPTAEHTNCCCDLPHTIQNRKQTNTANKKCYYKILQEPSSLCFTITEKCIAKENIHRDLN